MTPGDMNGDNRETLGPFARRTLVVVLIVVLALLAWRIIDALLLAFIGVLLAMVFRGLAGLISRRTPIPIGWAMLMVAVVLILLITLFGWLAGPRINQQLGQLAKTLPGALRQVEDLLNRSVAGRYLLDFVRGARPISGGGTSLIAGVTGIAATLYGIVANIILVIVSALYFSVNPESYRRGILLLVPRDRTARVAEVLDHTARTLQYWLLGQLVLMFSVGALVTLGLWLVGVPLAFVLGIISGLLEFVPVIGPLAGAIPGVLIALTGGWVQALYAVLVYAGVQQLENHLFTPLVQKTTVDVPPALVVLAIVAFGYVFGFIGVFVATPLTAVALVWIKMFYVQDVLGRAVDVQR
jgi:predicted PurR-regulated permease PerM